MSRSLLELKNISIEFPGVKALDGVNFSLSVGEIHAVIGANGAGKSTLMKVISGAYTHYSGEIMLNGEKIEIQSPRDAQEKGIQIVYQEVDTALIPYLSVAENIMLHDVAHETGKKQWINWKRLHKRASDILESMNINLSTKRLVSELTLAEKQMVLIARALSRRCEFLILDEPTAPLSQKETKELFRIIRRLKEQQVGIIFISHRLPEIFEICEEITIMRNGQIVAMKKIIETTQNQVVEYMLGRSLEEQYPPHQADIGETVLEVRGLKDTDKIKYIDLYVRAGEIVGLAGLVGAGKTEICKAIFGAENVESGEIKLNGKTVNINSPYVAVKNGIAFIPEERRKEGIFINETVGTNLSAVSLNFFTHKGGFLNRRKMKQAAQNLIARLGIKTPSDESSVSNLSGGNQQKVAIGKWLVLDAVIYLFDEPTKGVDVGAKKDIFELIIELAKRGKAIIYASSELDEIMGITNRVYCLYDGQTIMELDTKATNEEEILYYSTGGR
ncbi:sugar ABC transporter ATP-binding protein [Cytobacillus sp. Hz8]|uniref:sugar ABC transporter ATP-binding protein n=1 Tax=Cytobacillus sp. Hz8 TaxID=3347168 RepID=UPI0035D99452